MDIWKALEQLSKLGMLGGKLYLLIVLILGLSLCSFACHA